MSFEVVEITVGSIPENCWQVAEENTLCCVRLIEGYHMEWFGIPQSGIYDGENPKRRLNFITTLLFLGEEDGQCLSTRIL